MSKQSDSDIVLLVDPEPMERSTVAEYLRSCGYQVFEAGTASEALEVLGRYEISIIITDAELRDANGFQLLAKAKEIRSGVRVIVTRSAERTAAVASDICDEGPLERPYHPQQLMERIRRLRAK